MNAIKTFFKTLRTRVWFGVSLALIVLMVAVIVASQIFSVLLDTLFGGDELAGRDPSIEYFSAEAASKKDAFNNGNLVTEELTEEGIVLLKNAEISADTYALPLDDGAKISVFGKNSVDLVLGGSGSGAGHFEGATTLYKSLENAGFKYNPELKKFYESNSRSGSGRDGNPAIENGGVSFINTGETPYSRYDQKVLSSYDNYKDAALIVLSRISGEGWDLPRYSETSHYLQLTEEEQQLVDAVTAYGFGRVIVIINSASVMEIDGLNKNAGISAILHMAGPGYSGANALGKILKGEVNPSGHTVDTWAADFSKDPTWNNFSNNLVAQTGSAPAGNQYYTVNDKNEKVKQDYYFSDYEEGIYIGYRYYETRFASYDGAVVAINETEYADGAAWYDAAVTYPFGYGLSYTKFDWELESDGDLSEITDANKSDDFTIKVRVYNNGSVEGKDVVELYARLPYNEGGIEKSYVVLCGFAKTPMIQPGTSEVVEITFNPYDIASYDYSDANENGFAGYELEAGDYALTLQTDAHNVKGDLIIPFTVVADNAEKSVCYKVDPVTGTPVVNRFDDADDEIEDSLLSRNDWAGTWPTRENGREFSDYVNKAMLDDKSVNNPNNYTSIPTMGATPTLKLIELRGLDYNDDKWETLLDSLTFDDMLNLFNQGAFGTIAIVRIGKPGTLESDGPVGFTNFMSEEDIYGTVAYATEVIMGSTWNVELVQKMGEAVGEEGIIGKKSFRAQTPYSGWYAPGLNLHRSPFGGRNYEYFSEDGFLSGKLAAAEISGANSKGVYTYMKHFALNDQETNRDKNGLATWATEQSMRELYFRPFEIAVKEGNSHGVMSSFNRIGTRWTGGDYRLLTEVLRNEWGFVGSVICDFNVSSYMNTKQMIYAGGDLNLTTTRPWMNASSSKANDVTVLREAAHRTLYNVVNSCAMNGIDVNTEFHIVMALWKIFLIVGVCVISAGIAVWGFFAIFKTYRKKPSVSEATSDAADNSDHISMG